MLHVNQLRAQPAAAAECQSTRSLCLYALKLQQKTTKQTSSVTKKIPHIFNDMTAAYRQRHDHFILSCLSQDDHSARLEVLQRCHLATTLQTCNQKLD